MIASTPLDTLAASSGDEMLQRFANLCHWTTSAIAVLLIIGGAIAGGTGRAAYDFWPVGIATVLGLIVFSIGAGLHYVLAGPSPDAEGGTPRHSFAYVISAIFSFALFFGIVVAFSALLSPRAMSDQQFWIDSAALAFLLQCATGGAVWLLGLRQERRRIGASRETTSRAEPRFEQS